MVQSIVHSPEIADGSQQQEAWLKSFDEIMQRLRTEATRRNKIVHSLYIFDFMEIGHPPLRSKRTRKTGEISFDQEQVDAAYSPSLADPSRLHIPAYPAFAPTL
ncbi:hypothetical protein Q2941_10860 [Bradyrhizobium sp. UFLA05-153]